MLFWLFIILLIIGGVASYLSYKYDCDIFTIIWALCIIVGGIGLAISVVFLIINYSNKSGDIRAYRERYDSLVYQLENDIYDNDNYLGKRDLYNEIQKWNENLAWYKEAECSFWLGIYIPNIYDEFKFIELE